MYLLSRTPELFRLALGLLIMFILCLPEFFKVHEAHTVVLSCLDSCLSRNATLPLCTFNHSCKRPARHGGAAQTVLLVAFVNALGSLKAKADDVLYPYKHFNVTVVPSKEEVAPNTHYLLEIHVNSSTVRGGSAAKEFLNDSCLAAMMEEKNDCLSVSLQLKSDVEYPMCTTKIIWLTMVPVVLLVTIATIVYKIAQENQPNCVAV